MAFAAEAIAADPVPRISKGEAVYHALKGAILLRRLEPGEAVGEQQVAVTMGCAQGTVREALLRLQDDGLVRRRGYRGTVVSHTSMSEAAEMAIMRIRLETQAIRRAHGTIGPDLLRGLAGIVERMQSANESGDAYAVSELDRQFHLTLFQAADMPILEPVLSRCALHMHRYTFANQPERKSEISVSDSHAPILEALAGADPEGAASAVRRHIEAVLEMWSPELLRTIRSQGAH